MSHSVGPREQCGFDSVSMRWHLISIRSFRTEPLVVSAFPDIELSTRENCTSALDLTMRIADGTCVVDMNLESRTLHSDVSSGVEIATRALVLLRDCVDLDPSQGGIVSGIGVYSDAHEAMERFIMCTS